jgi:hypothetical protein
MVFCGGVLWSMVMMMVDGRGRGGRGDGGNLQ